MPPRPSEQIRFCKSRDGTRIAYSISGTGPPLIWIAHWVRHLRFDWDSPVWGPWLRLLTRRHTLISFDWRGCGLSDRDKVEFSFEKYAEDLEAIVEASGLDRFVLLAMGGLGSNGLGVIYAAQHPDRVSQLVLCGPSIRGSLVRATTPEEIKEAETRLNAIELGWPKDKPAYGHFFTSLHIPNSTAEQFSSFQDLLRLTTSPANGFALLRTFMEGDVTEFVPRVRCPTLVLHAREDAVPIDEGREVASLIPDARFVPLDSRNFLLLNTEPAWQQFVAELDGFLPMQRRIEPIGALQELTEREREVLGILAEGVDNYDIAARLDISEKTVRNHVSIIFGKLGVNSRAQAVARARDAGIGSSKFPDC